jgi:hypothetical protein
MQIKIVKVKLEGPSIDALAPALPKFGEAIYSMQAIKHGKH